LCCVDFIEPIKLLQQRHQEIPRQVHKVLLAGGRLLIQSPDPSAPLAETEETPETAGRSPDAPEPAAHGYPNGILF